MSTGAWIAISVGLPLFMLSILAMAVSSRRQRHHAAVLARADFEHNAIMRGEYSLGLYGAFQPTHTHRGQDQL